MTLYKILGENSKPCNGGTGEWFLPKGKRPGKWMPKIKTLIPCQSGYHICRADQLLSWLGPTIWEVEYKGDMIDHSDKLVVQQARLVRQFKSWNDRAARLFAVDCAERVLHIFENQYPNDSRVRNAMETSRKVANGELPVYELAAARDAVWDAGAAARAAVWDAGAAARAAAWDAARDAAWAAAQDAARAAARAAAQNAARDARAAARAAARDAVWDAEREWQTTRLLEYLNG